MRRNIIEFFLYSKPYVFNFENPLKSEATACLFGATFFNNYSYRSKMICKMNVNSDSIENLTNGFEIKNSNGSEVKSPIEISHATSLTFKLVPESKITVTFYPRNTLWQRIKDYFYFKNPFRKLCV